MVATIGHFIDGTRTKLDCERRHPVYAPASGRQRADVELATAADVDAVVTVASTAAARWSQASLSQRSTVLFAYRERLSEHRGEIASLITAEHGKVHADALGEVARGIEIVEYACGIPTLLKGEHSTMVSSGVDSYSLRQSLGVVAGITPFNFPAMVPLWMFPIAIACGNSFVLKPSEKDPSAPLRLAELFSEAGLPDGVLNVVNGDAIAADALLNHPDVAAISFVGSTPIARSLYATAASTGKRVQALGGAKNHMIVMPDADLDQAADAAVNAGYGSAGERCMAISVVVTVGDVADELVARVAERTRRLVAGPGTPERSDDIGPLVTGAHRDRVRGLVDRGVDAGAELVVDGRELSVTNHEHGFWLGPCLFDDVHTDMEIYTEEIFGPVLSVLRCDTYDEALDVLRANPYANGASIFTRDGRTARAFRQDAPAGMVGINVSIPVPMAYHSFGGSKASLFGDTHIHGPEGVKFYTRYKAVTERWPEPDEAGIDLGFPTAT